MKMSLQDRLLARGYIPDSIIRWKVRRSCKENIDRETQLVKDRLKQLNAFINHISGQPIAIKSHVANLQHYEVNTRFFKTVLGPRMKYSSCFWPDDSKEQSLHHAEIEMLKLSCERAEIKNGMHILELGCGWGSLTIYMAEMFPESRIVAVSNSATQKQYIDEISRTRGLHNITVVKADMNHFHSEKQYDRIISIEMFEHMRNWPDLFSRVAQWLVDNGKVFLHFFTYDGLPYLYNANDPEDWMARNFFDGGMMPSEDLIDHCQDTFNVEEKWKINGKHYQKTLEAWLKRMDEAKDQIYPLFSADYGKDANMYWNHWRVFFMSCAEVFGFNSGNNWTVHHNLLSKA